ncbi:MAG: hypothetical protein M3179_10955 [Actinomycetota bacterium]|nr:hypothetical protein [Actinomycetota bacterium]
MTKKGLAAEEDDMGDILGMIAFGVVALTTLFVLSLLTRPLVHQRVMVQRLRRDMRQIDVVVVDWKRDFDTLR